MRKPQAKVIVRRKAEKKAARKFPAWTPYAAAISLTLMVMLTINFRAFTKYSEEQSANEELTRKVEDLNDENLGLQEDIYYLRTDPKKIEREAKKLGLKPRKEKIAESAK